jgi:putative alpha-1,2-mannosidase
MSAWAIFSMMGIYPVSPAQPIYTFCTPKFEKITIHLNREYYKNDKIVITSTISDQNAFIDTVLVNEKEHQDYFISHQELIKKGRLQFILK